MSREILFRGKDLETGKWLYGSFIKTPNHAHISTSGEAFPAKVEPKTISQYTGLTDKNGVKIFEGDIVLITKNTVTDVVAKIFYSEGAFRTNAANTYDGEEPLSFWLANDCDFEVIGNIYDNPELLNT